MNKEFLLLDTHAFFEWITGKGISLDVLRELDTYADSGLVFVSHISFWELALLCKKGRIEIDNISEWKEEVMEKAPARFISPSVDDMIRSTLLPDYHVDPFDRLLVAQALSMHAIIVTRDALIKKYNVKTSWF